MKQKQNTLKVRRIFAMFSGLFGSKQRPLIYKTTRLKYNNRNRNL